MTQQQISYDAAVIQEFASRLYRRASSIIATSILAGILLGLVLGSLLLSQLMHVNGPALGVLVLFSCLFSGLAGFSVGLEKAFKLRLEAQIILCQVQVEKNTRKDSTLANDVGDRSLQAVSSELSGPSGEISR